MSMNTFGHLFRVTTWGESHGPALGATVDGCPPGVAIDAAMLQHWLDRRKPGQNKYTTQRREPDEVEILSGVYEGQTTGTPIQLMIRNTDQRSKDYSEIAEKFRPGHVDITYWQKYGIRDPRGGGRSSARETAARVAAGEYDGVLCFLQGTTFATEAFGLPLRGPTGRVHGVTKLSSHKEAVRFENAMAIRAALLCRSCCLRCAAE